MREPDHTFLANLFFSYITSWHPNPVLLPGKSHGRRSLVGCSPWGRKESDTTELLHFHFSLSCIGEGNGNPLQCSCLENPRDGGAWWAAVCGVAQSRTQLKRLSSSSSVLIPACASSSPTFLMMYSQGSFCFGSGWLVGSDTHTGPHQSVWGFHPSLCPWDLEQH